jgi:hypothetical protein
MGRFVSSQLLLVLAFATPVHSNAAAGQQQQDSAEPAKPLLTLNGDAALITILIQPDKTGDFELVLSKLKEALANSPKPERKVQAAGWRVMKSTQMAQGKAVYVMHIDPVVKGEEYDITRLIAEVFPVEVQELFLKYKGAFAGRVVTELVPLFAMQD